eukprot:TRINITY_DN68831_c0_g1_i1.p1 TRINITY_DN68831_c0_g1~~TRINITY_DN68831_c0_g1_i1.p1  ORF type:complete len:542 (+),score=76.61 TRINITY_DN68831_c0_g1_i1:181-1806(+)
MAERSHLWRYFSNARLMWVSTGGFSEVRGCSQSFQQRNKSYARDKCVQSTKQLTVPEIFALEETVRATALSAGAPRVAKVLCPEAMESANFLRLHVPPYTDKQLGVASWYGPVALDVVLEFCGEIRRSLAEASAAKEIVCVASSDRIGACQNSQLLVGVFLVIEMGLDAKKVARRLLRGNPEENRTSEYIPDHRFPTPWHSSLYFSSDSLTVGDCLSGLEAAVAHGWLDPEASAADSKVRRKLLDRYDAIELLSVSLRTASSVSCDLAEEKKLVTPCRKVRLWVAADPVTVAKNPQDRPDPRVEDRRTCFKNYSGDPCASIVSTRQDCLSCDAQLTGSTERLFRERELSRGPLSKFASIESGNLDIRVNERQQLTDDDAVDLPGYARWLRDELDCRLLVRLNTSFEKGLPPGGSYGDFFWRWGIDQLELPFADSSAPPPWASSLALAKVIEVLRGTSEPAVENNSNEDLSCCPSVLVHCRAGVGRSIALVGAIATSLVPDLSGAAFFGWVRLARPGAVQARVQERFLRSLDEQKRFLCSIA